MLWILLGVWLVVMIPGAYFMMVRTITDLFGGGS
jgi:succinate dehydrogenase / fumarate reductase, cytochrome b subunit